MRDFSKATNKIPFLKDWPAPVLPAILYQHLLQLVMVLYYKRYNMKKKTGMLFSIIMVLVISAFTLADSIIKQLGISHQSARQHILNNIIGDFRHEPVDISITEDGSGSGSLGEQLKAFRVPRINQLAAIIQNDKAGAAKELCNYVKQYVNSEEFTSAYTKAREAAKPTHEPYRMDAAGIAGLKKSLKEMEDGLAKMKAAKMPASAVQQKQMEDGIAAQKKMIVAQNDPTPNKTKWNKMYPPNPADAVKARLQEYLAIAATVDFTAVTTGSGKNKVFVNPAYEKKSLQWKAVYRAGKEVNTVVTTFVNQWLKEGVMTGNKQKMADLYKD